MNDLGFHLSMFALVAVAIVVGSAIYAEPDDSKALKSLPKRFSYLVAGCALLTGVMLLCQAMFN